VPGLLLFLALGMFVGSEGLGGVEYDDVELTQTLGTIALVLILFEGGLSAGWKEIRPVLGTAISLAFVGTIGTALIAGLAATWLLDLSLLEGLILGSAIAATDSAAIFAVLRGSTLRRRIARALEGESGLNDPVAVLLVVGFIDWLAMPDFGIADMALELVGKLALGAVLGVAIGFAARWAFRRAALPTPGLYPVATIAAAAVAYGLPEVVGGSGFLGVYIAGLILGTGPTPARETTVAFHQGVSWVAQIALFFLLGLLVFPSRLGDVAVEGLAISAVLIFVARPLAALLASVGSAFHFRERLMLGWAGLRGAIPIWLATFPVVEGVGEASLLFNIVFFVVVTSTLVQGATFEPLARRLGLTTDEPALPRPLVESRLVRRLGGESLQYRVREDDAIAGRMVKEAELPREALVNVIVREGEAIPPRGSTQIQAGDELHLLVRREVHDEVEALTERWRNGPLEREVPQIPRLRGVPRVFSARPWRASDGSPGAPDEIDGTAVAARLRTRRDSPGALVALEDGRYAVTGSNLVAMGAPAQVARWCVGRVELETAPEAIAWWQEVIGALNTPARR
jgi:cell volume regulation protein A